MIKSNKPNTFEEDCFDSDKPTFLVKVKTGGLSRQRVEETVAQISNNLKSNNANFWIVPVENDESNIELIWGGNNAKESKLIETVVETALNEETVMYREFEDSGIFDEAQLNAIKFILRKTKLKNLLNES